MKLQRDDLTFLPPHEPTLISGFHAYANQLRIQPGHALEICVSGTGEFEAQIWKLDASTRQGLLIAQLPRGRAQLQTIARGSYVHVENGLTELAVFTVELWFRTLADVCGSARVGLIAQNGAFEVALEKGNVPVVSVGGKGASVPARGAALSLKEWHCLAARWDGTQLDLWIDGAVADSQNAFVTGDIAVKPLRLGALENADGQASAFYTGDICAPVIYERALTDDEIRSRFENKILSPAQSAVATWKFDTDGGVPFRDESHAARHGQPVNYPLRLIAGPRRRHDSDWSSYDPTHDPDFGHAVRFMADTIVDCRWPISLEWRAPEDIAPGQYSCRLANQSGQSREVYFLICPPRPRAKMLCLSTTNTRVAYNFAPFDDTALDYGAYARHPLYPVLGHILGARRPNSGELWERQTVDFELPFYAWLDRQGIEYDLYSEWDLEANPHLLDAYSVVAWAGHSEYWTIGQYEALQAFNARGGHLLSLSGNTAYWRVSVDLQNAVLEVRKHSREPIEGTDCDAMWNASHHHQMDGLPGGIMREAGWPEHALLNTATSGSTNPPLDGPRASYHVLQPSHPLFHYPREIATQFPFAPDAAGYECDLSVASHLENFGPPASPHYAQKSGASWPDKSDECSAGLTILARAGIADSSLLDYANNFFRGEMGSEILLWEQPDHGVVFSVGSVLCGQVLLADENFSDFISNALHQMGIHKRENGEHI